MRDGVYCEAGVGRCWEAQNEESGDLSLVGMINRCTRSVLKRGYIGIDRSL